MAKIEVTFAIDADGILSVSACEILSSTSQSIEIKPSFGITEEEVNQGLMSAFENSQQDHALRLLVETKLDAENLILGVRKAMDETPDILTKKELNELVAAINSLQNVINLDNRDDILSEMEKLNNLAGSFIQKHLDIGAKGVIIGKHIDKI